MLTYGTETWAMKAENLHSLERMERMMVRVIEMIESAVWICTVQYTECGGCGEAWQIEVVWASGA